MLEVVQQYTIVYGLYPIRDPIPVNPAMHDDYHDGIVGHFECTLSRTYRRREAQNRVIGNAGLYHRVGDVADNEKILKREIIICDIAN